MGGERGLKEVEGDVWVSSSKSDFTGRSIGELVVSWNWNDLLVQGLPLGLDVRSRSSLGSSLDGDEGDVV